MHITRSHPRRSALALGAAIALTLSGCGTDHRASHPVTQHEPVSPEQDVAIEEIIVTGSRTTARPEQQRRERHAKAVLGNSVADFRAPHAPVLVAPPAAGVQNTENYAAIDRNPITLAQEQPVSTFSVDVDTGSYANVRRFLNNDQLPPEDAVRVEELINYFTYDYPVPSSTETPFSVSTELSRTPWNADTWLLQVGLKGYEVPPAERSPANLVFLLDVSGSMESHDKLPLLKKAFNLLTRQLTPDDRISIVVYAGASGVVLEPTPGNQQRTIRDALRRLRAGGSTNGAAGINLAYELAQEAFIDGGINRIILATDGDFNVGTTSFDALKDMAERKRKTGVSLTTLGFGTGNYNDHLMEQLADAGNGNYAYIDSEKEARKVLVNEVSSTLQTIAKDVKIQIEFNPDVVAEYRLIGYENRMLKREDFTNDKVDAGDIGAGHTVTALYELMPTSSDTRSVLPLRYGAEAGSARSRRQSFDNEAAFVRLRYKQPDSDTSTQISTPILTSSLTSLDQASHNLQFSAAVAAFGQILNGGVHTGDFSLEQARRLAREAIDQDPHGYRHEFVELVAIASDLHDERTVDQVAKTD